MRGARNTGIPWRVTSRLGQLAKYIAKTMPDDDPGTCVGEDAEKVAAYIHDAFYSKTAQARNRPAADRAVAAHRPPVPEHARRPDRQLPRSPAQVGRPARAAWRVFQVAADPEERGPDLIERVDPDDLSSTSAWNLPDRLQEIRQAQVRDPLGRLGPGARDGRLRVHRPHRARRAALGQRPQAAADRRWVKSGNDTEYRESIRLLGGRVYPLRLEFSKGKQGEDDKKKLEEPPPDEGVDRAAVEAPQQADEVIPRRNLSPIKVAESFVVQTPFPPDDRSVGYERGTSVSKAWDQATTDAAIEVGGLRGGPSRASCREPRTTPRTASRSSASSAAGSPSGRSAGRSSDEQKKLLRRSPVRGQQGPRDGRQARRPAGSQVAAVPVPRAEREARRLRRGVAALVRALGLAARPGPARRRGRGQAGHRGRSPGRPSGWSTTCGPASKVREFLLQWLRGRSGGRRLEGPEAVSRSSSRAIASDLRTSLDLFLEDVVWSESSDFRRLLLADELYLNGRLAKFYGAKLPAKRRSRR